VDTAAATVVITAAEAQTSATNECGEGPRSRALFAWVKR
jgi:hypothetical protein